MSELWKDSQNIKSLIDSVNMGKPLVLFVGAGINCPIIPVWDKLLNEILTKITTMKFSLDHSEKSQIEELIKWHTGSNLSLYEKASLIKIISGKQYHYFIKDILYKDPDRKLQDTLIPSIVKLCRCKKVHAVVSYNYDDLLLSAINTDQTRKAYNFTEITHSNHTPPTSATSEPSGYPVDLPFYFVHGFIPRDAHLLNTNANIVLSYDEYFSNMLDPYSWQTITQSYFIRNYTCLFIGASLTDWNMLRLIQYAQSKCNSVYIMMAQQSFLDIDKNTSDYVSSNMIKTKATIFDSFGVKLIISGTDYDSVKSKLELISQNI